MKSSPDKKFLIIAPIIGGVYYWKSLGNGNTDIPSQAHKFPEVKARELCEREPLLRMVPAL
jgi:hypothetical protein